MSIFTFDLSEELRAKLEEHRIRLGCRSAAETLRVLISSEDNFTPSYGGFVSPEGKRYPIITHSEKPLSISVPFERVPAGAYRDAIESAAHQWEEAVTFGPQKPKPGSRLKGPKK